MVRASRGEGGFVLAMVVMLLFAIAVAGTTGYLVVNNEFALADAARDSHEALAVARAGLQRFTAEQLGRVADSAQYAIGNGIVSVTAHKVVEQDSVNHLYYLEAHASVTDPRVPDLPTSRVVGAYGWHRLRPIPHKGAVWISGGTSYMYPYYDDAVIDGSDHATASDCSGGGTSGVAGLVRVQGLSYLSSTYSYSVSGSPSSVTYPSFSAFADSTGIRWDILQDPDFPVDAEGWPPPDFDALPADSFPVWRYDGNLTATYTSSGRGVLIVTGTLYVYGNFTWDGIILAGTYRYSWSTYGGPSPVFNGMVIGGLDGPNVQFVNYGGTYNYHSCNVYAANLALSYLELQVNSVVELQ